MFLLYHFFLYMAIAEYNRWEEKAAKKAERRSKKIKPQMRVSGASVKQLSKILNDKC
jgi:hypothetical protein